MLHSREKSDTNPSENDKLQFDIGVICQTISWPLSVPDVLSLPDVLKVLRLYIIYNILVHYDWLYIVKCTEAVFPVHCISCPIWSIYIHIIDLIRLHREDILIINILIQTHCFFWSSWCIKPISRPACFLCISVESCTCSVWIRRYSQ